MFTKAHFEATGKTIVLAYKRMKMQGMAETAEIAIDTMISEFQILFAASNPKFDAKKFEAYVRDLARNWTAIS